MGETNKGWSEELHYMAGLCELAASGVGSGVDWEQVSKDLRVAAGRFEHLERALSNMLALSANTWSEAAINAALADARVALADARGHVLAKANANE